MIEFAEGDFFDHEADIRVNTVNCVGVMGAGVALQFKTKFPKMYEEYVRECNLGRVKIGKPHVWVDNDFFNSSPIIINFPTKDDWKKPSEYDYIDKGLVWLRRYLEEKGKVRITLPALGCGHGGLDWTVVKKMIIDSLEHLEATILVFEPASSQVTSEDESETLTKAGITKLLPNDIYYPKELIGRSATEIYLKGDKYAFQRKMLSILVNPKADEREKSAVLNCVENFPDENITYLLSYNSSFEIDLVKTILQKKFKVILVVPYGLLNLKIRKDIQLLWDEKRVTIVSISKLNQSWSSYESLNSLKFRIKIANVLLITHYNIAALEKFGRDLADTRGALFFLNYWNEKIDFYEKLNALPIGRDKETQKPKVSPLFSTTNR